MSKWTNSAQFCILTYRLEVNKKVVGKPILVKGREMGCGCEGPRLQLPSNMQEPQGSGEEPDSHALKTSAFWACESAVCFYTAGRQGEGRRWALGWTAFTKAGSASLQRDQWRTWRGTLLGSALVPACPCEGTSHSPWQVPFPQDFRGNHPQAEPPGWPQISYLFPYPICCP